MAEKLASLLASTERRWQRRFFHLFGCFVVLLLCCLVVLLFCRCDEPHWVMQLHVWHLRRSQTSSTATCVQANSAYLFVFFFSFRFPIFCVCPFLFVCWFVGWLVVCFVCLQIACRLNPFRWLFRLCVPSFSFFFFTSFSMGVCDCIASGSRRRRGRAPSRLPPDSATFVVASAASSLIESGNGGGREVLLQGCYCQMGNTL